MNIRHIIALVAIVLTSLSATAATQPEAPSAAVQGCTYVNTAITGSETINYNLYFNWKFVWLKAGTATMVTKPMTYKGQKAFFSRLETKTSKTIDKYFRMRDTLMAYFTPQLTPLYYRKGASEGKRYYVDEVWYSYPNGKCTTKQRHQDADGEVHNETFTYNHCVSDMLNSFQRVRNMNPAKWKVGHVEHIDIAGGSRLERAKIVYKGKKTIKADNDKKYPCLIISYVEKQDGKDHEIARFFVTDNARHVPVRIDLFLKFGSAKAFLK